jgi:hypothetical protein
MSAIEAEHPNEVVLGLEGPRPQRRVTVAFRIILAIPHYLWVGIIGWVAELLIVIAWFVALVIGRMPDGFGTFLQRYLQYYGRVYSYGYYLMTDRYPPFALDDVDYPVTVSVPSGGRLNRAAVLFRLILLVPAALVVALVSLGVQVALVFIWLIVLVAGRLPNALFEAEAAILRYQLRVFAFGAMLTSEYPRGLFGDKPGLADMSSTPPPVGMPGQPRITRLVLSKAAKRLIVFFMTISAVFVIGIIAVSAMLASSSDEAADDVEAEHAVLEIAIGRFSAETQTCGLSGGPDCVHAADRRLAEAFERFREELRDIDFPFTALAAAEELEDDATVLIDILHRLEQTSDVAAYQSLVGQLGEPGRKFDVDYADLLATLGRY